MFFPEQSQVLALTSDDASSPECVQQVLVAEANRNFGSGPISGWRQQNKIAMILPSFQCLPVVRAKERAR